MVVETLPGQLIARWFEFLPPDPVADLLLSLALLLGGVLSTFALRLRGRGHFLILVVLFLVCETVMVAADNAIIFYLAWEVAALLLWAIGRLDAGDQPETETVWPVQVAGVVASIAMILGLWSLGRDSGTFVITHMRPAQAGWVSFAMLGAVLLKTLTLVGYAWRESPQRVAWASSAFLVTAGAFMIGIYPFARLLLGVYSDLSDSLWREAALWVGLVGAVLCALAALGEDDVKRSLSYGALGQLLTIFAAMAVPSGRGLAGVMLVVLVYSGAVAGLYLAFGIVEATTGERRVSALGGVAARLPGVSLLSLFASLALAGVPPLGAFLGQTLVLATYLRLNSPLFAGLHFASLLLTTLYLLRLFGGVFLGPTTAPATGLPTRFSIIGLLLIAAVLVAFAFLPFWSEGVLDPVIAYLMP